MNPLKKLSELGQSVWYDYIRRDLYEGPLLKKMIEGPTRSGFMAMNEALKVRAEAAG